MIALLHCLLLLLLSVVAANAQDACFGWADLRADLDAAKAAWQNPDCYTFSYRSSSVGATNTVAVEVQDGSAVSGDKTMDDFFAMVEDNCFGGCPMCTIKYSTTGYPVSIFIDKTTTTVGEELRYNIYNVQTCAAEQTDPVKGTAETEDKSSSPRVAIMSILAIVWTVATLTTGESVLF